MCVLQGLKYTNIKGLNKVCGMRQQRAEDDIELDTVVNKGIGHMPCKAIDNQHPIDFLIARALCVGGFS